MGGDRWQPEVQTTTVYPELGGPHRAGHPGEFLFLTLIRWNYSCMDFFLPGTRPYTVPPGCHWLHEVLPIINQPVRLGFPHRVRRYRRNGPPFSSLVY